MTTRPTGPIPRRAALALGALALAPVRPALAQVVPPAFPCASRRGDVVGLLLEGTGAPAGTVAVLGHAFRPGDVPDGAALAARGPDGRPIPAQLDVVARHPDRSARFGIVSLAPAAIPAGSRAEVILSAVPGPPPPAPDHAAALGGRSAVLELDAPGTDPWRADLLAAFRAAPSSAFWQSGPIATQARIVIPVPPTATGGTTSLRVVADVSIRADGTLWTDVWLRNDAAMRPGGGTVMYGARLLLDGREALRVRSLRQHQYTAWGRLVGSARGGPAPAPPLPRHDANHLADTGAVPRYDLSAGVEEAILARYARATAEADWAAPLGARGVMRDMPATGGRADIGPVTQPAAVWLMTGDPRAAAYAIGQGEAAGSVPWHMWDPSGGSGNGGWLDVKRYPRLWTDGRGGPPPGGLAQGVPGDTGWTPDTAHGPDLPTVPLLLTGRRAFLDELQAQAAWNVIAHWPAPRGNGDAIIVRGNQVRGAAWGLRQLGNAAWLTPEGDPNGAYLRAVAAGNWTWLRAQIPEWTRRQGEAHGWIPGEYGTAGALPPWQQDYFASTAAAAAKRGVADARAVLDWMENFLAGRFLSRARGFEPNDGAAYLIAITPENAPNAPYPTWAAIGTATRARGWSNGSGWARSEGDYAQLALQTLGALVDVTGSDRAKAARAWLLSANAPFTAPAQIGGTQFNIVPRDAPRIPSRAPRCRPTGEGGRS